MSYSYRYTYIWNYTEKLYHQSTITLLLTDSIELMGVPTYTGDTWLYI